MPLIMQHTVSVTNTVNEYKILKATSSRTLHPNVTLLLPFPSFLLLLLPALTLRQIHIPPNLFYFIDGSLRSIIRGIDGHDFEISGSVTPSPDIGIGYMLPSSANSTTIYYANNPYHPYAQPHPSNTSLKPSKNASTT